MSLWKKQGNKMNKIAGITSIGEEGIHTQRYLEHNVLFEGNVSIPSYESGSASTVVINDSISNYEYLMVIRQDDSTCISKVRRDSSTGKYYCGFVNGAFSDWNQESINLFSMKILEQDSTHILVSTNRCNQLILDGSSSILPNYTLYPLTKIIGLKLKEEEYTERISMNTLAQHTNKYSNKEEIIGTWIDGKPIYRKVLTYPSITVTDTNLANGTIIGNISNIDTLIRGEGMSKRISGKFDNSIPYFQFNFYGDTPNKSPNQLTTWWRDRTTGNIYIRTQLDLTDLHLILEYTKL